MVLIEKINNTLRKIFVKAGVFIISDITGKVRLKAGNIYHDILENIDQIKVSEDPDSAYALDKDLAVAAAGTLGGSTQATAQALTKFFNKVTSGSADNNGVKLDAASVDKVMVIFNASGQAIKVFPVSGESIDGLAVDAAYTMTDNSIVYFACKEAGKWIVL